jgi:CheY-like chemotaxis protein
VLLFLDPLVQDLWSWTAQAINRWFSVPSQIIAEAIVGHMAIALVAARDYPDLIILMMTGYADRRERAHGLDALTHDAIAKPFTIADIRFAVASALAVADSKR